MKVLALFFLLTFSSFSLANVFEIHDVIVKCDDGASCDDMNSVFKSLRRKYSGTKHFQKILKLYIANEGIKKVSYHVQSVNSRNILQISLIQKTKIVEFQGVSFSNKEIELPSILPIKEGDFYDHRKVELTIKLLKEISRNKGYPHAVFTPKFIKKKKGVSLYIVGDLKRPILIERINIISKSAFLKNTLHSVVGSYKKQNFDLTKLKTDIEAVRSLFVQYGFYLTDIEIKSKLVHSYGVVLFLEIKKPQLYSFHLTGVKSIDIDDVKKYLSSSLIGLKRKMTIENVEQYLVTKYEEIGVIGSKLDIRMKTFNNTNGEEQTQYFINVEEGRQAHILDIAFKGNVSAESEELESHFYENATELVRNSLYDADYISEYPSLLRELYISKGYLGVYIDTPSIQFDERIHKYSITYKVREGVRTIISDLNIKGVSEDLNKKLKHLMDNQQGRYFNPLSFQSDINIVKKFLKEQGFYFSRIKNLNSSTLVSYRQDNTVVELNLEIETGLKLFAGEVIIIGNDKTRKILIKRELAIKKGDLITSDKIERSQANLLSLGIFNSVQVEPVSGNEKNSDLIVFVREKDFGLVEVAPGIRSDLGLKLSTTINYNNIDGMNKRITFKGSVNKRINLNSLDETRRQNSKSLIEYDTIANFAENHIFHSDFDFNTSISKSRKRFYSFDADIQRLELGVSYDFTDWLSLNTRYQLETISQYDATVSREHGHFQIGSITPSLTFDFRNRSVNTTKGAMFTLSCEYANPALASQSTEDLTIDYYKLINRNKFYFPFSRDVILAVSTAFGIQENLANSKKSDGSTEGYIPNIKVFRLSGADIVRGYEDSEINRLVSKKDISEVEVNSRAFMANLKFEPRLFLTDSTMLGVFYDAGRIFVDKFESDKLRSSVGLSFKYLTPVGSLDFDYGIKLLRKKDSNGTLDSPGRLHVSIGFF